MRWCARSSATVEWIVPLEMFAREGDSKLRIEKMMVLSSERIAPADELWIFTDEEAALLGQAKNPSLGTYGGGMSGSELFCKIPPNIKIIYINPGSPEKFNWYFQTGGGIEGARLWARSVALEDQFSEWERTGVFDETAFAGFPFITFQYAAGGVMMLPYESLTVNRAAVFTAPDCVEKFLSRFSEGQRAQIKEVTVEGATMLRQLPELGVDGMVVNIVGPGATFVHDFAKKTAANQVLQTPAGFNQETFDSKQQQAVEFFNFGLQNTKTGNYQVALLDFTSAIQLNPGYTKAYQLRGTCFNSLGHYREAIDDFSKVLESNPNDADTLFLRGFASIRAGNPESAVADFGKSIEINSDNADAFFQRGIAYTDLKNYDETIRDFDKVIELTPEDSEAYVNRGVAFLHKNDCDKAIEDFSCAVRLNPQALVALQNRAIAYERKGLAAEAIADLTKAVELNAENADVFYQRGVAYVNLAGDQNYDNAIGDFDRVIALAPDLHHAYNYRGLCYYNKGDYDRTVQDSDKSIELKTDNDFAYLNRARAFAKKRDFDKAFRDFDRVVELSPDEATAYFERAEAYYEVGKYDQAVRDFTESIRLGFSELYLCYHNRAVSYRDWRVYDKAVEDFSKAIELNPNFFDSYLSRGAVYAKQKNDYGAIKDFSKAIELNPHSLQAYQNRAIVYERNGSAAEAEADCRKIAEMRNFLRDPLFYGLPGCTPI